MEYYDVLSVQNELLEFCELHDWSSSVIHPIIYRAMAKALALEGNYDDAKEMYRDQLSKDDILDIAEIAIRSGDRKIANSIVSSYCGENKKLDEQHLIWIAGIYAEMLDFDRAIEIATSIKASGMRASLLLEIVRSMLASGVQDRAASTLALITDDIKPKHIKNNEDDAIKSVASCYIKKGMFDDAISFSRIKNEDLTQNVITDVALKMVKSGHIQSALSIHQSHEYEIDYRTVRGICDFLCQEKRFDEALKIAQKYDNHSSLQGIKILIGIESLKRGEVKLGLERLYEVYIPMVKDPSEPIDIKYDFEYLITLINKNELRDYTKTIFTNLAVSIDSYRSDDIGDNKDFTGYYKAKALIAIGEILINENYNTESRKTLRLAVKYVDDKQPYSNDTLLFPLAAQLLKHGDVDNALICYKKVKSNLLEKSSSDRNSFLLRSDLVMFSRLFEAVGIDPESIYNPPFNPDEVARLSTNYLNTLDCYEEQYEEFTPWQNKDPDFKSLLIRISDWYTNYIPDADDYNDLFYGMQELIRHWSEKGEYEFAIQISNLMGNEYQKAEAFSTIAKLQIKNRYFDKAFETSRFILDRRENIIPEIAAEFVKYNAYDQFKRLIGECISEKNMTYRICALLAEVYPDQIDDIAIDY